jgi:dimethylhistidine N-methyltransferase
MIRQILLASPGRSRTEIDMGLVEIQIQAVPYNPRVGEITLRDEVLNGLRSNQKNLPPKLFYDQRGSQLFDQICELEEYYLTRTETAIMRQNIAEISAAVSPAGVLIEYGSGSSAKTRWMLDGLMGIEAYVPVDISQEHLYAAADRLGFDYPHLSILPIWADFTDKIALPPQVDTSLPRLAYFPGSTLGNFYPDQAVGFLNNVTNLVGSGGGLLIGVDLQKDAVVLNRAYNDRAGVTAAFNINMLTHLNRE